MSIANDITTDLSTDSSDSSQHALIVDADGAVDFLRAHPGWYIFPGNIKWDGTRWLKTPAKGCSWTSEASDDPSIVRGLWSKYVGPEGTACVAVHVGKSGLVVLDQDQDLEDATWIDALAKTDTLVLTSCSRQMPHYVFQQPSATDVVVIQDWPAGEVKCQNGYIFVSDLPPKSGVIPLTMPPHIVKMLRTSLVVDDDFTTVKMSETDLDIWLDTTVCQLEHGEDKLIAELVDSLIRHADTGHRRDAMRGACMTLAIEATAGLYGAEKAWTALTDAYSELRNDPRRNGHKQTKEWSAFWEKDSRVLLAGAVEKVEAGRFDEAIQDKRDRFSIWTPEEEASWIDFFENAAQEEREREISQPPTSSLSEHTDVRPPAAPSPLPDAPVDDPTLPEPEPPVSEPEPSPDETPPVEGEPQYVDNGIDPYAKLRKEVEQRGGDLDLIQRFAKNFSPTTQPYQLERSLGKEVQKLRDRRLVKHIADSLDSEPVLPSTWDWLAEGGYAAVLERSPGAMLARQDGVALLYDRGCAHFIGDKSTGKSWLLTYLGVERMQKGEDVVWLDYETDEQQVAERFIQAGATLDEIVHHLKYFSMKGEPIAGAVETVAQLNPLPSVLVVDSVDASMAASGSEDENSSSGYHAWRNTLTPLTELMLVALIEHTGHENSHRARGASAKGQQADQEFSAEVVKAFSKDNPGLVKWICRKNRRGSVFTTGDVAAYVKLTPLGNKGPIPACLNIQLLKPSDPSVGSIMLAASADEMENEKRVVREWLAAHIGWFSATEIREQTGLTSSGTMNAVLGELAADGLIKTELVGRWDKYACVSCTTNPK